MVRVVFACVVVIYFVVLFVYQIAVVMHCVEVSFVVVSELVLPLVLVEEVFAVVVVVAVLVW